MNTSSGMPPALSGSDLTGAIGDTPLVRIEDLGTDAVQVYGKLESMNPGGSVKDRAAWSIIQHAEREGALGGGRILLDATSGNTGIAYAWIGAARGHRVRLCVPANANAERQRLLRALGAEVILTDPMDGTDGAIREAERIVAAEPGRYFHADQYSNPANPLAHERGTALEIWAQTEGRVTHLVAGIGTSGTLVGTARGLARLAPGIEIVAVQPDSPLHVMEGLKHLATARVPRIYDPSVHRRTIEVASEDAIAMAKRMTRSGIAIGWSAGAALVAAERVARELTHAIVVAILPDGAERYASDPVWEDEA